MVETLKESAPDAKGLFTAPASGLAHTHAPGHFTTKGEAKFDRIAYAGIGYVANVALSLAAVFWSERTRSGQWTMEKINEGARRIPFINEKTARYLAGKSLFLTGGFAVLLPIKWMEDRKLALVKKWDRKIYGEEAVANDPQLVKSHKEIEAQPKQSWSSILGSRILSLIPFYLVVGWVWDNKSLLSRVTNSRLRGISKAECEIRAAADLPGFAHDAQHGIFFDRPIAWVARQIGSGFSWLTGNRDAIDRIAEMGRKYPAMIKEEAVELARHNGLPTAGMERDPAQVAWPYYFICEAITSAIVARAVYLMTRVLGPLVGIKPKDMEAKAPPPTPANDVEPLRKPMAENDNPQPKITTRDMERHAAMAAAPAAEAAR